MAVHTPGASRSSNASALKTYINTNLVITHSDGTKTLNVDGVLALFTSEMQQALTDNVLLDTAAKRAEVQAAVGTSSAIVPSAEFAASTISADHWRDRPGWPLADEAASKEQRVAKLDGYQGEAWALAQDIIYHFEKLLSEVPTVVADWVDAKVLSIEPLDVDGNRVLGSFPPAEKEREDEVRFYAATYTTDRGEESKLSLPAPVQLPSETDPEAIALYDPRDTLSVVLDAPPSGRNVVKTTLYRSSTSETGAAWQFVSEHAITDTDVTITNEDMKQEFLGEPNVTAAWDEPPEDLAHIVGLPNGINAGLSGTVSVRFSEAYHPYAWPAMYEIPLDTPWVTCAVQGQSIVVGTKGHPYLIEGVDPGSMSSTKLNNPQACVGARGMTSSEMGVLYPSPDGLCLVSGGTVNVITAQAYNREDWAAIDPANRFAAFHDGIYYSFHAAPTATIPPCVMIDLSGQRIATLNVTATAVFTDVATDTLYAAIGAEVVGVFSSTTKRSGIYRTGRITLEKPTGFAWIFVQGEHGPSAPASISVYWRNGGGVVLLYTATVTSQDPVRMPVGRSREWEVEVVSTARINRVVMTGSTAEMNEV